MLSIIAKNGKQDLNNMDMEYIAMKKIIIVIIVIGKKNFGDKQIIISCYK